MAWPPFDLTAAFHTVDHAILLDRLSDLDICEEALSRVTKYLKQRTQSVRTNGCDSPPIHLTCGVPQGSVLGPTLFTVDRTSGSTSWDPLPILRRRLAFISLF